jgi:penicillin-binding protein 1B
VIRLTCIVAVALAALLGACGWSLHREVESRFRGDLFDVPARVYARPLRLVPGLDVGRAGLIERLRRLGFHEAKGKSLAPGEFSRGPGVIRIAPRRPTAGATPEPAFSLGLDPDGRIEQVRGEGGKRLAEARLEPELLGELAGARLERRRLVTAEQLPPHLVDAILTIEDRRFYEHWGLDVRRIVGAFVRNVEAGRVVQGGSTITQQLVKNLYLSPERTLARKLREAAMSVLLELGHSKQEILEAYLNEVYLGQRGAVSIHGFGEASRHYFGKDAADVTLSEAALLAGLIRAPGLYSPFQHPEEARARRDVVLDALLEVGKIDENTALRARAEPLTLAARGDVDDRPAPHFVAWLRQLLADAYGEDALLEAGLQVASTLDPELQRAANRAVERGLTRLEADFPKVKRPDAPLEAGLLALDPESGDVLAFVGGRSFAKSQFNHVVQGRRQPGSAFKPIVALAALSRSGDGEEPLTLAARLEDEPLTVDTPQGDWVPANFDGTFRGQVTLREALEHSLNVPIARVALEVGPKRIAETARRLGIESPLQPVPALALGASEVTLLELTRAYATLAASGTLPRVRPYAGVSDAHGEIIEEVESDASPAFDPAETWLVTSALRGAVERGTAQGLRRLGVYGPVAAKTGTTNDFRDAWFLGYTPRIAVGVWVGFDDGASVGVPASVAALPIFASFLHDALGADWADSFREPPGIEHVRIEAMTGRRAGIGCHGDEEEFLAGTAPTEVCEAALWRVVRTPWDLLFGRPGRLEPVPPPPGADPSTNGEEEAKPRETDLDRALRDVRRRVEEMRDDDSRARRDEWVYPWDDEYRR